MSNASDLISLCQLLDVQLTPIGRDELLLDAPPEILTSGLIADIKSQRQMIIAALNATASQELTSLTVDSDETIDVREVDACSHCGSLEVWQSMAGHWRCQRCDPPEKWWAFNSK